MPIIQALAEYKRVGNHAILADVLLPRDSRPPVILHIHGGALISGSRKYLLYWQAKRLLAAGFAIVSIDYRLAPETKLFNILEDIQDAVAWVKGEGAGLFGYNPDRLGVMGGSAGGYLSLMCGTFTVKPRAIVSFYGYGDILGDWYTRPSDFYCQRPPITKEEAHASIGKKTISVGGNKRYTFYFYCRQQGIWPQAVSGYSPVADREKLLQACPAYNIGPDYPPTMLLHGDQDTAVPFEQ
ncbi:MAG: alpha/beta hydrolase [Chloroflexi bacterium]|nr:MAG: alpha/beta hydrolase [Chloroflexota bacterium]